MVIHHYNQELVNGGNELMELAEAEATQHFQYHTVRGGLPRPTSLVCPSLQLRDTVLLTSTALFFDFHLLVRKGLRIPLLHVSCKINMDNAEQATKKRGR